MAVPQLCWLYNSEPTTFTLSFSLFNLVDVSGSLVVPPCSVNVQNYAKFPLFFYILLFPSIHRLDHHLPVDIIRDEASVFCKHLMNELKD